MKDENVKYRRMQRSLNLRMILLMFTTLILMAVSVGTSMADNQSYSKIIYAFWPSWTDPSAYQPDWKTLTVVAYHSWEVNNDGTLNTPKDTDRFNTVKNLAHQNGVKVIISVKCFDKDTMDSIFAYHKDGFINNILGALQTYGADGINLDFEYPRATNVYTNTSNTNLFEEFMKTLYTKVKSKNSDYYISLNVAGNIEEVYRNAALSQYTDLVFLRGYNYHSINSSTTGASSPYNSVVNSVNMVKKYYPPNKIILGLYFSGYEWPSSSGESGSITIGKGVAVPMKDAITNADTYGRIWDSNSQTPWYKYKTGNTWYQTWYDDEQSLGLKFDYINSENIKGVGFWALGYEGNNANIWKITKEKFAIGYTVQIPTTTSTEIGTSTVISTEFPKITIVKPVETQKVPGFELTVSLIVLIILVKCIIKIDI